MPRELNERQQQVLHWVGQGCPDGVWEGTAHKLSCQALHSRGLVKVSRRQGQWSVSLTKAGQQSWTTDPLLPAETSCLRHGLEPCRLM